MSGSDERTMGGLTTARRIQQAGRGSARVRHDAPEVDAERLLSGKAWTDFCQSLDSAGRVLLEMDQPDDPRVRAQGFRYLLGLLKFGTSQAAELMDRDFPRFVRSEDSFMKWGAENADNHYLTTHIRSDASYRITGTRGSCMTFLIEVREGFMQLGDTRDFANLTAEQLDLAPDGSFEILVSREEQSGNWLPLHEDARQVVIRQYFHDWEKEEPATFQIERIGAQGDSPEPLEASEMAAILDDAANWVQTSLEFWGEWVPELRQNHRPGHAAPAIKYVGGADDIRYGNDYYRLAEGDALIFEFDQPDARYWSVQLCNTWFVTQDYANRVTSINDRQAHIDADGRCRVVLAHRDPGVENWLDTEGATEGVLMYRYIWTRDNPLPSVRTVPLDEVRAALPAGTPEFSPAQRREQIHIRQRAVALRDAVG
ncbi:DUF1214 domain-containing protein [Myxococcota bacterium]|nr:DUF1214 domain-containing protein [Myxococcota bacterium]